MVGEDREELLREEEQVEVVEIHDHQHEAYVGVGRRVPAARIVLDVLGELVPGVVDLLRYFPEEHSR